jgi:DNA-directed RNA polymerase II subunit RPB2
MERPKRRRTTPQLSSKLETVFEQEGCPTSQEPHPQLMQQDSACTVTEKSKERQPQQEREPSSNDNLFDKALLHEFLPKPQAFRVLKSYIDKCGFGGWIKSSFDDLVANHIPNCIRDSKTFVALHEGTCTKHIFCMSNPHVGQPTIQDSEGKIYSSTPFDCRTTRQTYTFPLYVDVTYTRLPLTLEELAQVRESNVQAARRRNNRLATTTHEATGTTAASEHTALPDPQIAQLHDKMELVLKNLHLDDIPCMVDSRFCARRSTVVPEMCVADRLDPGGYFIIEGVEKLIGGQEQMANNSPVVLEKDDKMLVCEVRSQPDNRLRSSSTLFVTLKPSLPLSRMTSTDARRAVDCDIFVRLPFSQDISVTAMFVALDVCTLKEMLDLICIQSDPLWLWEFASNSLNFSLTNTTITKLAAFGKIRPEKAHGDMDVLIKSVTNILNTEFLPHQGVLPSDLPDKRVLLGLYVRRVILVYLLLQPIDNREHYRNRRNVSVFFLSMIWRDSFMQWRKAVQQTMNYDLSKNICALNPRSILVGTMGRRMIKALKSGNLTINHQDSYSESAKGVSNAGQIRANTEYMAGVAHLLRTNSQGETAEARMPYDTGAVCRFDTPDGGNVGMTRNMTICAGVRSGHSAQDLCRLVIGFLGPIKLMSNPHLLSTSGEVPAPVLVNGRLIGYVYDPYMVREELRRLRSVGDMPSDVSLFVDRYADVDVGTLNINGDAGTFYWPLIRVDRMKECREIVASTNTKDLWPRLLREGVGELICKDEEYWHVRVAMYRNEITKLQFVTHVMIDECQSFSMYTNTLPHIQFNQAPRISFAATMRKQACGNAPATPCLDTCANYLETPQCSLVTTAFDKIMGPDIGACYQQASVCVGAYYGMNVEDSLTIKKEAVDRGFSRVQQYRTFHDFCNSKENEKEMYCLPPEHTLGRIVGDDGLIHNDKINPRTGVVDPGVFVTPNDIIVSKVVAMGVRDKNETVAPGTKRTVILTYRDRSLKSKHAGYIHEVLRYKTAAGHDAVSVTLRATKIPQPGDKFSSRHAQKTSLACLALQIDMPWCERNGAIPDIFINPHAMPSRMTIGHLLEMLHTKLAAIMGIEINGTPGSQGMLYEDPEIMTSATDRPAVIRAVGRALARIGLREDGCEAMYCGKTGKLLEAAMFVGPLSYMRLKHMVEDKQHARARGPMDAKTRQPEEGRAKNGGLRFGEMEKDVLVNHGAAELLRERLLYSSDPSEVDVCSKCGFITNGGDKINNKSLCLLCMEYTGTTVCVPFALVLQVMEMQAMHYAVRLGIDETTGTATIARG